MSFLSVMTTVESNIHKLDLDIHDIENEIRTTQDFVQELTTSLARQNVRLHVLQDRLCEKQNMLHSLRVIQDHRNERLRHENKLRNKIMYIVRCEEYLAKHSRHLYPHNVMKFMTLEEIVECAHKLHLIHCMTQWVSDMTNKYPETMSDMIEFPSSELDFETFQAQNTVDEHTIRISSLSSTSYYIIPVKVWYSLFEIDNRYGFSLEANFQFVDTIVTNAPTLPDAIL